MSAWHQQDLVGFDLETTGIDVATSRIVTASVVVLDGQNRLTQEHQWLVNPGMEIPAGATAVHRVTTEQAQGQGIAAATAVAEIIDVLTGLSGAAPIVAFNASYDFSILNAEARRYSLTPFAPVRVVDPFVLDKQVDRYRRGKRTLQAVSDHYGVVLEHAHTSQADAIACVHIARKLAQNYPELALSPEELHQQQVRWAAEQAASLQEFFRRRNPGAVVDGRWPIQSA